MEHLIGIQADPGKKICALLAADVGGKGKATSFLAFFLGFPNATIDQIRRGASK
ncbi:hypothetical protein [Bradyrhizobium ottawaense]|uniref:hypothetical protein n=1 Tax=Bradyrhizobium ottawaense TaxID=931866 RepID=UPI00145559FA|nr:hypothetical protein [Bradyrhizobium ottawaense]